MPAPAVDRSTMLGRRLRDAGAFAAALTLLVAMPGSHALSASTSNVITVAGTSTAKTSGATSLMVSQPRGTAAGMLLLAAVNTRLASTETVTAPTGWTLVQRTTNEGVGASLTQNVYVHLAGSGEPSSYSWTFSSSAGAVVSLLALTGIDPANPVDATSGLYSSNTASIRAPSVTTSQPGDGVVGIFGTSGSRSTSPPSGMTEVYDRSSTAGGVTNRISLEGALSSQVPQGATGDRIASSGGSNSSNIGQLVALRAGQPPPPPPPGPDFTLSLTSATATVQQGASTTDTAQVGALNGFAGTVSFSLSGLPSGVTASFSPATVNGSGSSTLTLAAGPSAPPGTYALTVNATSSGLAHSVPLALTVRAAPDFSLSLSPTSVTVAQGASATDTVQVGALNGFSGNVTFSTAGLPSGVSAAFSPASVAGSGSSTLTLSATSGAVTGTYTATVTATSGALAHSASLALTVTPPSNLGSELPVGLPASTGATYYVSTTGSDFNPGTPTLPWRTIQKALNTLQPGQIGVVLGGTYTENLQFSRAGTASAPITLEANPGDTVVLHAASAASDGVNWYPVQITGSYFRLHGFVIENGRGTSDANVYLYGGAHQIEVSGNEIRYGQDQGIFADATTSYLYILGNRIHDNGWQHVSGQHQSHGLYLEGGHDLVANNVIYNHPYGFGVSVYPNNHDTILSDNTIAHSAHSSIVVGGYGGVSNITIRNNILYDDQWGVEMDSTCPSGRVTVDHNVISAYRVTAVGGGCSTVRTNGGNIRGNPRFVDYSKRDLHLQRRSPAIRAAVAPWSAAKDADGRRRPSRVPPTIGAFQR